MAYGNYAPFYRGGFFNPIQTQPMPQMADNQGQYVPQYQTPMQANSAPIPQPTSDMIWVLNENEATSYPVAPNNSVVLWDKNNPTIYVKSVNSSGMPSMRILDFTERNIDPSKSHENAPKTHECTCGDKFATKQQFEELKDKFERLMAQVEEMTSPIVEKPKTTSKKPKESEE